MRLIAHWSTSFGSKAKIFWRKWKYGLLFLGAIPLFALIYSFFPNGFYQSTVAQEGVIEQHENYISEWLTSFLEQRISNLSGPSHRSLALLCNHDKDTPTDRTVHWVGPIFPQAEETRYADSVWAAVNLMEECLSGSWLQVPFAINVEIFYGKNRKMHFVERHFIDQAIHGEVFDLIKTTEMQCNEIKTHFPGVRFEDEHCFFLLSDEETAEFNELLTQYNFALKGTISSHNRFLRMFYLSTVTITTLGYGDIVPITDSTRALIALQSILGIVLIGLFIDSIIKNNREI